MPVAHISPADDMDGHGLMGHRIRIPSLLTGLMLNLRRVTSVPTIMERINSGLGQFVLLLSILHAKKVNILLYFIKQSNYYASYMLNSFHVCIGGILNRLLS